MCFFPEVGSYPNLPCALACNTAEWCTHAGSKSSLIDCDKDGRPDPVCTDHSGHFGFISSSNKCSRHWPNVACNSKEGRGEVKIGMCNKSLAGMDYFVFDITDLVCNKVAKKFLIVILAKTFGHSS